MSKEEMVNLIKQVWSDSMSDNGAIWSRSNAQLKEAIALYPELYSEALEVAYNG